MTARAITAMLAAALACCSMAAQAHQFHFGITDVSFNSRTGSTEIVHTYMAHDIEALLANLYQRRFDLTDPEDEAVLRKYIEKKFWMQADDKSRLPVRWLGISAEPERIVIYQEIENTPLAKAALVHNEVLIDFLPEQSNSLNLKENGIIRTVTFDQKKTDQGLR
ncbi:MAG: hypothetical protein JWP34_1089 [Massilia sp.]|jgi:hypothetical protein|nr:hypothetical protein [Massilia sp.]